MRRRFGTRRSDPWSLCQPERGAERRQAAGGEGETGRAEYRESTLRPLIPAERIQGVAPILVRRIVDLFGRAHGAHACSATGVERIQVFRGRRARGRRLDRYSHQSPQHGLAVPVVRSSEIGPGFPASRHPRLDDYVVAGVTRAELPRDAAILVTGRSCLAERGVPGGPRGTVHRTSLPHLLWWGAIGCSLVYGGIFLITSRPASIRFRKLGWMGFMIILLRLGLVVQGYRLEPRWDMAMAAATLVGALTFWLSPRLWLVRAAAGELRGHITTACRGLFLACEESPTGHLLLSAKGIQRRLRIIGLGSRIQLLILPIAAEQGKVALLVGWLSKQYPGPVPRPRVVLRRSDP